MVRRIDSPGQLDLSMHEGDQVPVVDEADVQQLVAVLELPAPEPKKKGMPKGWWTAEAITARIGDGWNERKVRAVARAAAPGIVSYPGAPGYKLWSKCTVEEIDHAIAAFDSQAKDMTARAVLYRNAYHRRFRG